MFIFKLSPLKSVYPRYVCNFSLLNRLMIMKNETTNICSFLVILKQATQIQKNLRIRIITREKVPNLNYIAGMDVGFLLIIWIFKVTIIFIVTFKRSIVSSHNFYIFIRCE